MITLSIAQESWPIAGTFTISRGSKTAADVVVVTLTQDGAIGRGECVPYPRYNETVPQVVDALEQARVSIQSGIRREDVSQVLAPYAARNALDCALWDLEAKQTGISVAQRLKLHAPKPLVTAFTISLDTPEAMAQAAAKAADRPLLKLKLGREGDVERLAAIRQAVPKARLIVDANEGWKAEILPHMLQACAEFGVDLVEQPLPAGDDEALRHIPRAVKVCADESAHGVDGLNDLVGKYDAINIKLDKTGGLTGALALAEAAQAKGLDIMVGCMLATSLAMAPAFYVAQAASVVDLDGPLLLQRDRASSIAYDGSLMHPPTAALWG